MFPARVQRDAVLLSLLSSAARYHEGKLWSFVLPIASDVCSRMGSDEVCQSAPA
jgi:hypothetical protein